MKPHVASIRRCKDGFRVDDYMGHTHTYATIDGALAKAREVQSSRPKRPQYVREHQFHVWQVMAPMIASRAKHKPSEGRVINRSIK